MICGPSVVLRAAESPTARITALSRHHTAGTIVLLNRLLALILLSAVPLSAHNGAAAIAVVCHDQTLI